MDKTGLDIWKCHCRCGCSIPCLTTQLVCDLCEKEVICKECGDLSGCHAIFDCGDPMCCAGCYGDNCWNGISYECHLTEKEVLENSKSS